MRRTIVIGAVSLLALAACGGGEGEEADTTSAPGAETTVPDTTMADTTMADTTMADTTMADTTMSDTTTADTTASGEGATLTVATADAGEILVDGEGYSLYLFTPDEQGDSTCVDACASTWPPLTGDVVAGEGVDEGLIGTVERDDGSTQVTYGGWPLYYYASDGAPGDTAGQGVNDVWYLVAPDGNAITGAATSSSDGGSGGGYDYDSDY